MSSNTPLPQVLEPSRTTPPPPEPLSGSERMVLWSSCAAVAKPTPTGPRNGPFGVNINQINAAAIAIMIVVGFICSFIIVAVLVRFLLRHRRPTRQHQNPPLGSRTPMPAAARSTSMPLEADLNMLRPRMPDPECSKPMAEQEEVPHQLPKRRRMSGELFVEEEHISKRRKMSRDTSIQDCSKPMTEQEEVPHQLPKRRQMSGGLFVEEEHISKRRKMSRDTSIED